MTFQKFSRICFHVTQNYSNGTNSSFKRALYKFAILCIVTAAAAWSLQVSKNMFILGAYISVLTLFIRVIVIVFIPTIRNISSRFPNNYYKILKKCFFCTTTCMSKCQTTHLCFNRHERVKLDVYYSTMQRQVTVTVTLRETKVSLQRHGKSRSYVTMVTI